MPQERIELVGEKPLVDREMTIAEDVAHQNPCQLESHAKTGCDGGGRLMQQANKSAPNYTASGQCDTNRAR